MIVMGDLNAKVGSNNILLGNTALAIAIAIARDFRLSAASNAWSLVAHCSSIGSAVS